MREGTAQSCRLEMSPDIARASESAIVHGPVHGSSGQVRTNCVEAAVP